MTNGMYPSKDNRCFVGGDWRSTGEVQDLHSPVDGSVVTRLHLASRSDVADAVASAVTAQRKWGAAAAHEHADVLHAMVTHMSKAAEGLAAQMTAETGRPIRESRTEVTRSLSTMRISAEEATRAAGHVVPMDAVASGAGKLGFTIRTPVGVVAAVTPFNAPLNSMCHKLGPALAGGNALVLKPHEYGSGVAVLMAEIASKAGLASGLFSVVHGGADIGKALTTHQDVDFVNFTGSGTVATDIVSTIGLKRSLLELGGNAPTIVHADADLPSAIAQLGEASFGLTGQSCVSTQRVYAHDDIIEEVTNGLVEVAKSRRTGDAFDENTQVGPLVSESAAQRVEQWVEEALKSGATLRCGGRREGAFYEPTVLSGVTDSTRVVCEEVFGPVVSVLPYSDLNDAFERANSSHWGLKTGVFTTSLEVAVRAARELNFGAVNVNGASRSRVDQEPSGGVKQSGWGKEGPSYAIREMTNERMVSITLP